jgi:hypothetical protein
VPEEAWKEGIEDKAASFIFMPDKFGIVCVDWFCADMFWSRSAFWARDETVRTTTDKRQIALLMDHSLANPFSFVNLVPLESMPLRASIKETQSYTKECIRKNTLADG